MPLPSHPDMIEDAEHVVLPGNLPASPTASDARTASVVDVDRELAYWRASLVRQPFYDHRWMPRDYLPAIRLAVGAYLDARGKAFGQIEGALPERYDRLRGASPVDWYTAYPAVVAVWQRLHDGAALN